MLNRQDHLYSIITGMCYLKKVWTCHEHADNSMNMPYSTQLGDKYM